MPVDEKVVDGVVSANFKAVGETMAFLQNLANANAVSNQNAMNIVQQSVTAMTAKSIVEPDLAEASGAVPLLQQLIKGAQTTPPSTP